MKFVCRIFAEKQDVYDVTEVEDSFSELCHLMYCEGRAEECYDDTIVEKMKERKLKPKHCLAVCVCAFNLGCSKVLSQSRSNPLLRQTTHSSRLSRGVADSST